MNEDELFSAEHESRPAAAPRYSVPRIAQRLSRLSIPSDDLAEGQILVNRYRLERIVSRTPHEVVLEASHLELGQRVLLRYLSALASTSPEAVARFQRGARKAREMRSEHAERVVDFGRLDSGSPYRAVELPRGPSLAEMIRVRGALPIVEAVDIVLTACDPVAEAHASGVVHRCLNTSNIFVERRSDGTPLVRVLDFGVSDPLEPDWVNGDGLTAPGAGVGPELLCYTSPEQIRSPGTVDARTDVWALGAILYELVAGAPLFQAEGSLTLLAMIAADAPTPLGLLRNDVPPELEQLVLSCLEKDPNARPRSVVEVVLALTPYASADAQATAARVARIVMRTTRPPPLPMHSMPPSAAPASSRALVRSNPPRRAVAVTESPSEARSYGMLFAGAVIGLGAAILVPRLGPALALAPGPAPVASAAPAPPAPTAELAARATAAAVAPAAPPLAATVAPGAVAGVAAYPAPQPLPAQPAPQQAAFAAPLAAAPLAAAPRVATPVNERVVARAPATRSPSRAEARAAAEPAKPKAETKTASADDLFGGLD